MLKKTSIVALIAVAISAVPAMAAIRIDFSQGASAVGGNPGWRVSNQVADPDNISESLEVGSASTLDGLGYLRVTQSTAGPDILQYIVVLPRMTIAKAMADGVGVDTYDVSFAGGSRVIAGGLKIYLPTDAPLNGISVGPVFTADITLSDHTLVTLGSTGSIESSVAVNLSNPNVLIPSLSILQLAAAMSGASGADLVLNVSSAGNNLSNRIMARDTLTGSASGSIFAVPEPGTLALLLVGGVMAMRRRNSR